MTRQKLRQALTQGEPINQSALREEINVDYVAATRAKRSIRGFDSHRLSGPINRPIRT